MTTTTIPGRYLSQDALLCLGLFFRYGRRRAGGSLRKSALAILERDPSFDLWKGLNELLDHGLVTALDAGARFALTTAGADRLRCGDSPSQSEGPSSSSSCAQTSSMREACAQGAAARE
jgi:hypothetical protein